MCVRAKYPSTDKVGVWVCVCVYTLELSHKSEILLSVITWENLEGIMLHVISQRKRNRVWFHLREIYKKQKQKLIEQIGGYQRRGLRN